MPRINSVRLAVVVGLLASLTGCEAGTSVSGSVTYDGHAIELGNITFLPANGKGPAVGAEINAGQYSVNEITPGKKTVHIIAVKEVNFALSSEEMQRRAEAREADPTLSDIVESADIVPENAIGNGALHEIQAGAQTMDFHLASPVAADRRATR